MRLFTHGLAAKERTEISKFARWILSIGNDDISDLPFSGKLDDSFISFPSDLLLYTSCDPIPSIVSAIYPSISDPQMDPCYFRERAIVTPRNTTVAEINDFVLTMTPGDKTYLS